MPRGSIRRATVGVTHIVVDNTKGAEAGFAQSLRDALGAAGFDVEIRQPAPQAMYDTGVHFVVEGVSIRVPEDADRRQLGAVAAAVRSAEAGRTSERRRVRPVPIYQGDSRRILAYVDVFGTDGL